MRQIRFGLLSLGPQRHRPVRTGVHQGTHKVDHPRRAVHHQVRPLGERRDLRGPAAHQHARHAFRAQRLDGVERGQVAQVVPANSTADGRAGRSSMNERSACPLSMPCGRSSRTRRPGSTVSPVRSASAARMLRRRSSATSGSAQRRVCTASACPLSSTKVSGGAYRREDAGELRAGLGDARRRLGLGQHAGLPAFEPVLPEDDEPVDALEAAVLDGHGGGTSRDDHQRADQRGQPGERGAAPGWARAEAGSSTMGASVPSKSKPSTAPAGFLRIASRLPTAVAERGEVTRPSVLGSRPDAESARGAAALPL